ncbi:D-alanine--poly(phosphoribitol) ligase subunit DltA [Companilactobacillus alimentarius]|uniref:D-alanine--D-alanyl carrier protein ligase n=1 Tax=Companilactobacillus alimentarius DSM 20249 TaxID=1423720 RepID=A0A2K9HLJ5_9LACO|nr:D-alanine--poly(phosphoribitol) ligase subunit DltA [Companilactobacillus alimentarius]AUI71865.1 D-alanine--poly(phosphoribitol) ligase subunit 1 [Companilactobacillus alimentarius DSM 20249]KRK76864.1 D-alanine--poly(phosphoribitol) ligase subunit 1 [Companilactobacillus alimentarius DSM 20249]MDT6952396.1 D-alanine--poly(phosphoribitol) ligase subunit DltA [Companilactobacillus alimentarius]GEO45134.1 D-alanine--poly(phosphoribitol) ligase subunit 1 [Companilactobacillus alimentarius]
MNKIIEAITTVALQNPDKICYKNGTQTHTYQELIQKSDRIASFIQDNYLPAKSPLIIFGGQQFEMLVMFLGSIKAGHAYIPVDDGSDPQRVIQINSVAKPALILNWSKTNDFDVDTPQVTKSELEHILNSENNIYDSNRSVGPDDNFYIIFTSGTTGTPKGVQISTNNILDFTHWAQKEFNYSSEMNMLLQAPFSFDLSVFDIYPGLMNGAVLNVVDKDTTKNFGKLQSAIVDSDFNTWVSTPSFFEMCLLFRGFDAEHLPQLKKFIFCGEELTHATAKKLLKKFPDAELYNTYGPTENTVAITAIRIDEKVLSEFDRLPIGYLKPNMDHEIIGNVDKKTGMITGELLVSGPDVSKGYLNNPVQTKKAFEVINGKVFYHTGDMVSEASDGLLFYHGRTDFQIKMHGYRIELEEVDSMLGNLKQVKQSCTVPLYNNKKQVSKMIACIVLENEFEDDDANDLSSDIKDSLKETTMEYMIPNVLRFVKQLPISKNGKIDRKTLIGQINE